MYEHYWELNGRPFEDDYSPAGFFRSSSHEAALLKLRYLVENNLGAGLLCGGSGSGKTAIVSQLRHEIEESIGPMVSLVFPRMAAGELLAYLAAKLGSADDSPARPSVDRSLRHIERSLRALAEQERRPTIAVEEAHLIDDVRVFECLHLLLNLRHGAGCPFSLLLVGGTSLLGRLERIPQLNDRIAIRGIVAPLSREETERYVTHRLLAAGARRQIFQPAALAALHDRSAGLPRRINQLADLALLVGFADELPTLGADEIHGVAEELPAALAA
jgi:general secretion pathway protein A